MGFGDYPAEFNPKIHGPYHPGRFYGKADTPLGEVKLGEFGKWLSRRNYTPQGMVACCSRAYWRWATKYLLARKTSVAPLIHFSAALATAYYFLQYRSHTNHRHAKYH
ncbi:putative ATP synthase subunit f, mitochondrial [Pomacea canaliculata]|uniref:putative ATP synthase subunit f, mitochondrial n=1 Tax=Pomacea canaliculata TaxID=400727 RepID=UPI000D734340|nr:putative ATP synthase subunit f, mitochondrial [Pomacea canaliculata]